MQLHQHVVPTEVPHDQEQQRQPRNGMQVPDFTALHVPPADTAWKPQPVRRYNRGHHLHHCSSTQRGCTMEIKFAALRAARACRFWRERVDGLFVRCCCICLIRAMDSTGNRRSLVSSLEREHSRRLTFLESLRRRYEKNRADKGVFPVVCIHACIMMCHQNWKFTVETWTG